jgi:hypothetical protein
MPSTINGVVKNGVIIPKIPLPEGAQVEIYLSEKAADLTPENDKIAEAPTPAELRRMPREQRQAILAAAAALAEEDYLTDKELTGFDAFQEEELDDDESQAPQG